MDGIQAGNIAWKEWFEYDSCSKEGNGMNTFQTGTATGRQVDIWMNCDESFDVKIQVETRFCHRRKRTGIGVLISSNEGGLIGGWSLTETGKQSRSLNDAKGLRLALSKALQGGWK
ncbi:hypothetical protein ACH5RR_014561 [Cinchona calisaya]|uniref:RNase H type-1 domain-containing protein n=1 Tax=Cinchona calisaya TaxID=153742 RepID=A0ABD3A4N1_9GENT